MITIEKDNRDAAIKLADTAVAEYAREINTRHVALEAAVGTLKEGMLDVLSERLQIAKLVEAVNATLGNRRFFEWWEKQKLPYGWSKRYLTIAKTSERNLTCDKDQLRLNGVIEGAENHNEGQQRERTGFEWVKHALKISSSVTEKDVIRMGPVEQQLAYEKLKPIKALIETLETAMKGRSTGDTKGGKKEICQA